MSRKMKNLTLFVFLFYIFAVLTLTFIVRETMVLRTPDNRRVILQPFREFEAMLTKPDHFFWFMQIMLNIALFIPFGFLLPTLNTRFKTPLATVMTGFLFSGLIETMQYITGRGLTEVDDVITNTLGAAIGYAFYYIMRRAFALKAIWKV